VVTNNLNQRKIDETQKNVKFIEFIEMKANEALKNFQSSPSSLRLPTAFAFLSSPLILSGFS
jgi:hypothetical protein